MVVSWRGESKLCKGDLALCEEEKITNRPTAIMCTDCLLHDMMINMSTSLVFQTQGEAKPSNGGKESND